MCWTQFMQPHCIAKQVGGNDVFSMAQLRVNRLCIAIYITHGEMCSLSFRHVACFVLWVDGSHMFLKFGSNESVQVSDLYELKGHKILRVDCIYCWDYLNQPSFRPQWATGFIHLQVLDRLIGPGSRAIILCVSLLNTFWWQIWSIPCQCPRTSLVIIIYGSGNGLLLDDTNLLPKPMLIKFLTTTRFYQEPLS